MKGEERKEQRDRDRKTERQREREREFNDFKRQKSWSPHSVSCVAARKIVRRSVLGPVRDIA